MNSRSSWFVYDFSDVLIRPLPRFPSQCYDPRFRFRIRSLYEVFKVQTACRAVALHAFRAASQLMADNASASGDGEIRTHDPLLARQVLSQLSYTPIHAHLHDKWA